MTDPEPTERERRLAEQLRRNLRRRKAPADRIEPRTKDQDAEWTV